MVIRSIRYTLMLWYVGILAVILCAFGGVLYTSLATSLIQHVDKSLALQAVNVANTIAAFWQALRTEPLSGPGNWEATPAGTLQEALGSKQLPGLIARWAEKTGGLKTAAPIRIIDRSGQVLGESAGMVEQALPLTPASITITKPAHQVYETFKPAHARTRLLTYPVVEGGRIRYFVQIAGSLQQEDAWLAQLRLWLLWLIPFTLVVTSAGGWFLATEAMRPVGRMITQARRVGGGSLHQRIDVPQTQDELQELGVTFNAMLARLEQTFKQTRQFSAAASHELRTPLTAMKGELEVALRRPRDVEEYRRVLRTQLATIDEMTNTIDTLLTVARSDFQGAIEWRPLELAALAREVSETWKPAAKVKALRLDVTADGPAWVIGERRLLERLIANLLDNAVKHTPPNGRVLLNVKPRGTEVRLSVQDTGPGIPAEELPQIFERFFKPRSASQNASSTGLGLGLCRWIVEAHHGRIDVASSPGQGTTVSAALPYISPPA